MSIEDNVKKIGWNYNKDTLSREFDFLSFKESTEFINDIVNVIEESKYYPSITIEGSKVKIVIKQINDKSITLANRLNKVYENYKLNYLQEEDYLLSKEEEKEKARHRTRGPYRKSSSFGLG